MGKPRRKSESDPSQTQKEVLKRKALMNQVLMQRNPLKLKLKILTTIMLILKILVQRRMKTRTLIPTILRRKTAKKEERRKINFISEEIEVELLKSPKYVIILQ